MEWHVRKRRGFTGASSRDIADKDGFWNIGSGELVADAQIRLQERIDALILLDATGGAEGAEVDDVRVLPRGGGGCCEGGEGQREDDGCRIHIAV